MGGRCQLGSAPAGGRIAAPTGGLRTREPKTSSGMERGWRLAWDDERRGDVGEEGMASLGLAEAAGFAGFWICWGEPQEAVLRMSY